MHVADWNHLTTAPHFLNPREELGSIGTCISAIPAPRILVAAHNSMLRDLIVEILSLNGAIVVDVADGHSAVVEATRAPFDLCILDIGMNGLEACRLVRKSALPSNLPVLFLTGYWDGAIQKKALDAGLLDAGLEGFLAKPFPPGSLWNLANSLMLLNRLAPERNFNMNCNTVT